MERILYVDKAAVMEEVANTTSYTGAKMMGGEDEGAWERISTVDEDSGQLERFWEECRADMCQELMGLVTKEGMEVAPSQGGNVYAVHLDVTGSFDDALLASMRQSLYSFFVTGMAAKWYVYTNKQEAGDYADKAAAYLDDVHRKAVFRKRPVRPTYD